MTEKLSINDFKSHFETDFARSNLFHTTISGVQLNTPDALEHLKMSCKGAQVPGITFIEGKYILNGFNRKSAIGADLDPVTLTFFVDGMGKTLEIFEEWSNKILDKQTGKFGYKENYQSDIQIELLNRPGSSFANFTLFGAYPTNIEAVDMSWDSSDTIIELSVSFNFDKMISSFNGVKPKLKEPVKNNYKDVFNKASNFPKIPTAQDVLNKSGLDIPSYPVIEEILKHTDLKINVPEPLEGILNKVDLATEMINKARTIFK